MHPKVSGYTANARTTHSAAVLLVLGIAATLRLYALARDPLWYDEAMHAYFCRDLSWSALACRDALIEPFFCLFLN
ncbi:MAG TPA: hypothetical protein ENN80_04575, partial [Candidatus Hydrogenedentes bacterium]|nr:hypothetical protein [Candidatus Hydrogenedentota bacterium]